MAKQKFTVMRSVSLTEEQGAALDRQAAKEGRKVGNLIRLAVCDYLRGVGELTAVEGTVSKDEDEDETTAE